MSSSSQRPRSITRQRSQQNGSAVDSLIRNRFPQVGQVDRPADLSAMMPWDRLPWDRKRWDSRMILPMFGSPYRIMDQIVAGEQPPST